MGFRFFAAVVSNWREIEKKWPKNELTYGFFMAPAVKVCDSGLFEAKTGQKPHVSSILGQNIAKSWQGSFICVKNKEPGFSSFSRP